MSNTTTETDVNVPGNAKAAAAAKAFLDLHPSKQFRPPLIIPRQTIANLTPEQAQIQKSIHDCRRDILNIDESKLKESVLGAITNPALDDESRKAIVHEIKQGREHLPKDYDEDEDALVIESARELIVKTISKPAELIKGILYQGGKMSYNAPSKMGKTWSLLHLGISISEGLDWLGFQTTKSRVLFINPELQNFSFESRIQTVARNLSGSVTLENFDYVSTRGRQLSSDRLLPLLEHKIQAGQYGAIILDSIYKLYPNDTEENSSSDVGRFLNGLEKLANHTGAAVIYSHHYSKGNQSAKAAIDRSSGAGAWGRDPDAIVSVTEHESDNAYTVEFNLRDFKPVEPITINVNWPNVIRNTSLDPKALKTTKFASKYNQSDLLRPLARKLYTTTELQTEMKQELGMSSGAFYELWRQVQAVPGVTQDKDKRWFYCSPACNPILN